MTVENNPLSPAMRAEQAGHMTARTALNAMRLAPDQATRLSILIDSLIDVYGTPIQAEPEAALNGFCVGLLATLEAGLGLQR